MVYLEVKGSEIYLECRKRAQIVRVSYLPMCDSETSSDVVLGHCLELELVLLADWNLEVHGCYKRLCSDKTKTLA